MRQEAWRAYLDMALGITEASSKKALKTVKQLVGKRVSAEQLQALAEELARASAANREAVVNLVRVELDRALSAVGLAKADEVETLTARVRELEAQLRGARSAASAGAAPAVATGGAAAGGVAAGGAAVPAAPAKKAVAKKTVAKKAVAKKAVAAATPEPVTPAAESAAVTDLAGPEAAAPAAKVAKTAVAKKAAPTKAGTTKAGATKTPAKKAAAKKAAPSVGDTVDAPAPGPAGPQPADGGPPPVKRPAKKATKRTPGSGEPVP
jgi:polyhydroxyalkanoate synthesis regulator phasin